MDGIAIASQVMAVKQANVQQAFSVGVMKMQMDQQEQSAAQILDMANASGVNAMESSVTPYLGKNLNVLG